MKPCICFGICFSSKWVHLRLTFFLFSNLGLIIAQQASIQISCLMAGGWHTSCSPISKMHILGEGPGETPSVLRCLIWLTAFSKYKTSDERLAAGHSFCPILMSLSEAFSFFFFSTLTKFYYTKALSNHALSLALDWIPLLCRPRIPESFTSQWQLSLINLNTNISKLMLWHMQ